MAKKRRRMLTFKINEISAVDRPAQGGARATIMKRENDPDAMAKGAALTSAVDGHTHLVMTEGYDGPRRAGETSWNDEHTHPWVRDPDTGAITLGEAKGHTHDVAVMVKADEQETAATATGDDDMSDKKTADAADLAKKLEAMQGELAVAKAMADLTDDQKAFYAKLDDDAKTEFLAASPADRASQVAKAAEGDPVVYTDRNGVEYRKSDNPLVIKLAKQGDEQHEELAKLRGEAEQASLEKRADEVLKNLGGERDTRIALMKAVDGIKDESVREAVIELLKSNDNGIGATMERRGTTGGIAKGDDPDAKLDALAKARAEKDGITFAKAYDLVMQSAEGQALYAERDRRRTS